SLPRRPRGRGGARGPTPSPPRGGGCAHAFPGRMLDVSAERSLACRISGFRRVGAPAPAAGLWRGSAPEKNSPRLRRHRRPRGERLWGTSFSESRAARECRRTSPPALLSHVL